MIESMRANLSKAFILLLLTFAAVIFINVFENSSKLDNTIQDALAATGDSVTDPNYSKENFEISVEDANIMDFSTAPNNVNDGTGNFTIEYIDQNDSEKNDPTNSAHWQYASETTHYTWSNYNATGGTGGVQSIDLTLNKLTGKEIIYRVKIKDLASNAFEQYYVIDDIAPSLSIEQEIFLSVTKRTIEKASLNANQQKYETTIGNTANNVPIPTITEKNIAKVDVKVSQFGGTMTTTSLTGPTNALFEGSLETVFENLLGEGGYIQIIITDKVGNEDIFDLFYDNKAPTLTTSTDQNNREIVSGVASGYRIETSANDGFTYYFTTSNDSYSATAGVINKEVVYFDIPLSQLSSVGTADIDIAVADMYGNRAASRSYITLDEAAPELSNVSLTSNNSTNGVDNEDLARGGDVVTLTFTSTEELYNLGVYILDRIATCDVEPPVEPSVNYTYTCIMPISEKDTDGTLTFVIYYEDEFGNEGATSTTDDSSSVTIDNTKPAITTSDLVTNTDVTITSSTEFLYYKIGNGDWVSIMTSATSYAIPIASLTEGENIIYLMDAAGNISSKPIKVTKDTTAPTITTVTIESNNASDSSFAQIGDVITIIFTMSEASSTLPTVSIQSGGTDVTGTAPVVTQDSTDTKKYTVTYTVVATDVEGVITFTISATDGLNSVTATQTTDSTSVTIDNTTPTIDTTQGSGNVTITSNNTNAATFALDGNTITLTFKSSEELKNIIVTIAGTTATVSEGTDNGDGTWTYVATIEVDGESDGAVSITIDATDLVGKSLTQVTTITDGSVTIDNTAPIISLKPANEDGILHDLDIVNYGVQATASNGTISLITKDGQEIDLSLVENKATEEGVYVVTATDTAGNVTTATFTIDKTLPVITLTKAVGGVVVNDDDVTKENVKITAEDNVSWDTLTIQEENDEQPTGINNGHIVMTPGTYTIVLTDEAGNIATKTFTIDRTAPVVTLTEAITDGREVNDNGITNQNVKIALNEGTYTITKNGTEITDPLTDNTATEEGVYVITATDTAGNETIKTFTIDKTAPVISVKTTESTPVELNNNDITNKEVEITFTKNNATTSLTKSGGSGVVISSGHTVSEEGVYVVSSIDTAGNVADTFTFTIDKTAPVITLTEAITDGREVNDNGTTNQNVKVTLNEGSYTITKDGSSTTLTDNIATEEGVYVVTATDTAGNVSKVTFTIDKTAPTIKVETTETTPVSVVGGTTNQNVKITVADTDLESLTISRGGVNIIISSGYIAEVEGVYTVTAEDEAGNKSTATFTIDKTAPVITLKAYDKDTVTDLIGDLSDNGITNQNVEVTSNNATDTIVVTDADSDTVTLDTNSQVTTAGIYTVTVTDEAGNKSTATFTIDRTAPVITLTEATGAFGTVTASGATKENVKIEVTETNLSEVKLQKTGETEVIISSGYIAKTEGEYTVTVTDMAGNTTVETFTIDKTDPVIILKEYKQDPVTDLIGDLSDNGVTNQNVEVTSDNATDTIVVTDADSNPVTLDTNNQVTVAGVYTVTVTDAVGNETIATFTIDRTAPTIEVKTTEATPVTVNDGETTNQNVKITISETTTTTTTTTTISKDGSVAATITSGYIVDSEGTYVVTSIDEAGNEATFTFTIDKTAPTATITEFNTNNTYNTSYATTGDEIKLVVEFSETVSSPSFVLKYGDGTEITVDSTTNVGNTYTIIYTVTTTSVNGLVSFTVNANDSIGNSIAQVTEADTTSFVQIDKTKPVLSIETEGTTTSTNTTGAFKIISDRIFTQYKINQGNWITVSETKNYTVVVPFGTNTITVMDLAGNVSNEVTAIVDSSSGIVIIVDGSSVNNTGDFTFITNVEAETVEKSTDGGTTWETVTVEQAILATLTFDLSGLTTGVTLIRVTDLDTTTSDIAEVMYDATAPTIDNISIVGNNTNDTTKVKAGDTVTLTFDSTEELFYVSIKIAGKEIGFLDITETYNDTEGKWQYEATYKVVLSDVDGAVTYEILATDIADNEASISAAATSLDIDNTAPKITLETDETTPSTITDGQYTNQNVVISSDGQNDTLTITLNGSPVTLTDNKAAEEGAYIVTSVDEVGNVTEVTFTIDKTTPTLSLSTDSKTVSNGDAVNEDVTVTASDQNLKELVVTKDGLTTTIQSGHVITAEGVYTVTVTDIAGNTTVKTFTIDKTAPVLTSNVYISQGGVFEISSNEEFTEYSIDGGTTWEPVTAGTTHSYDVSAEANGEYTFQVKGIAGNPSNEITLIYDSTVPSITLTTASDTLTNNGVTNENVTVTASDTLTNIVSIYLERSDGTTAYIQNGYVAITEGTYTITATDEAGNETTIVFTVDKTKPNIILTELDADNANQEMGLLLDNGVTKENVQIGSNDTNVTYTITKDTVELTEALTDNIATEAGVYTVKAEDVAGNISSTVTFTIDRKPPTLIIKDQASEEVFTGNITNKNLIGEVSDNVDVSYIRVEISDGTDMIITSAYVATKEGDYTVTVVDTAGNSTIRTFTIDKTAPVITLKAYDKDTVTDLIGDLSDNGITNQNVEVTSNNATDTIVVTDADSDTVTLDTNNQVTAAGVYTVTVTDEAGNETIATFTIDRTPPTVVIKEQTSGEEISSGSVSSDNIVGEVSDASGIASIRIIISDGTDMIITSEYVARTEGSYQVIVTDNAGNATEVTFTIDRTAPVLTSNTMINNTGSFVITSTESFTEYSVDGGTTWETATEGTEFPYDVTSSGEGSYKFQVKDSAGNISNELSLIYDATAPTVTLTKETSQTTIDDGGISNETIIVTFSDNLTGIAETLVKRDDGSEASFSSGFKAMGAGLYTIKLVDGAGNTTTQTFTIDKTAPVITSNTMINNTASFEITSTESFTEYSIDGGTTWETTAGTTFTYDVTESGEGTHKFQVKDAAGNISNELELIYDITKVTIDLENANTNETLSEGAITFNDVIISWDTTDSSLDNILMEVFNDNVLSLSTNINNGNSTGEFNANLEGDYKITATDKAGNVTIVTFTIDQTAPIVLLTEFDGTTNLGEIEYDSATSNNVEVTTEDTTDTIKITNENNEEVSLDENNQITTEGTYTVEVTDIAGNVTIVGFRIDRTAPTITLVEVETDKVLSNGATTSKGVVVGWDPSDESLVTVFLERVTGDNVGSGNVYQNGNVSYEAIVEGEYKVIATDLAGNFVTLTFIVDSSSPVITSTNEVISEGVFEITSTEEFLEYSIDGGTTWETLSVAGTTYTYDVSETEGVYTFQVKDEAGNISNELRLVFDSTAPEIILTNIGTQEILENGAVTYGTVRVIWSDSNIEKVHLSRTSFEGTESSGYIDSAPYYDTSVSGVYTVVATDAAGKETTKTFTVDNTEVTVETVSIESNNDNTAFAKTGDVITITFTVGQTLQIEPTVSMKTGGNDVTGTDLTITQDETETTKYTVTYTVVETDTEGQVTFIITVSNQARGIQVTKTTDETKVTIDNTAPTIEANETINNTGAFTITSTTGTFEWYSTDNGATWINVNETTKTNIIGLETGTYQIQVKDSVGHLSNVLTLTVDRSQTDLILNITSEAINNTGTYTFETNQNIIEVYISTDNTTWTLLDTVDFSAGVKAFTLTDLTNETTYIKVKNALGLESNIVEVKYDNTTPVIDTTEGSNNVVIESNNADKTLAVNGDTITLTFIASEQLTNIEVTIANTTATVNEGVENTDGTWTYTATLVVDNQANGTAEITIDAADIAGNTLTQITQTTNGSSVIIDNTAPVIDTTQNSGNVAIESNNADKTLAVNGDTITLTFKVSEQLTNIVVTIANTRATVNEGVENTDGTWTYTATLVVNNQANGEVSITIDGTDKSGNILEQVTTITDGKVIIDNALVVEAEKVNVKINPSDLPLIFTVGAETPDWTKYFEATIGENTITIDSSMISTNVDMAKAGTYTITLTIKDSNGNELSEMSLNVKVIEEETKTEKDDDNLIFGILNPDDTLEVSLIILIILTTLMAIMVVKRATTIKES